MDDDQRLTELEIKFAHQEVLLEQLHGVICEQQKSLDLLEAKIAILLKRAGEDSGKPPVERPPHY